MKKTEYIGQEFIRPELTIQECKEILSKNGEEYTDQEIEEIRNLILNLAEIEYTFYMRRLFEKINSERKDSKPNQSNLDHLREAS